MTPDIADVAHPDLRRSDPTIRGATGRDITYRRVPVRGLADCARATAATSVWNPSDQAHHGEPR
jgi:hypothetical protein